MNERLNRYYNVHMLWFTMLLLTMLTYTVGKLGFNGIFAMLLLLLSAGAKATFIIRDYMELRGVSLLWRVIMYGWLVTVCTAIAVTYILGIIS